MLWGPPGTAKSAMARDYAKTISVPFVDVRLPLYDPVDIKGIPGLVDVEIVQPDGSTTRTKMTKFYAPDFLPRDKCVILFDELANALPATQTACQRIILDRTSDGGWVAHPETFIMAASNRTTDRCGVNKMPLALDNRLVHMEVLPDVKFWETWLLSTYSDTTSRREAASMVASFIAFRHDLAYQFDPEQHSKGTHGVATFRSWESVVKLEEVALRETTKGLDEDILREAIKGTIGVGAGTEFNTFVRLRDNIPDVDAVLAGKPWDVPAGPDVRYALVGAIASRINQKTAPGFWGVMKKLDEAKANEFAICLMRLAMRQYKPISANKEFIEWAKKFKALVGC